MSTKIQSKHIFLLAVVVVIWTLIVIGFSTSMGARPLRMYDWGPPVFSGLITLAFMLKEKNSNR